MGALIVFLVMIGLIVVASRLGLLAAIIVLLSGGFIAVTLLSVFMDDPKGFVIVVGSSIVVVGTFAFSVITWSRRRMERWARESQESLERFRKEHQSTNVAQS